MNLLPVKKKYKRLTNKEKQFNKEFRERMREKGLIPPVKPRLNRNKFAKEVIEEFNKSFKYFEDVQYLYEAISVMKPTISSSIKPKISSEQIGVLKVLKIAMGIKKFEDQVKASGEKSYKYGELYEKVINPIRDL